MAVCFPVSPCAFLAGLVVSLDGCVLSPDGCVLSLDGCVFSLDGCVLSLDGCVLSLDVCVLSLAGCALSLDGCVLSLDALCFPGWLCAFLCRLVLCVGGFLFSFLLAWFCLLHSFHCCSRVCSCLYRFSFV